ncbi:MAG TPA: hypothetical protein VFV34_12155 [Blastocatellia bacterium]|nr:hypothetical protein [Blastocatellia bacterium]
MSGLSGAAAPHIHALVLRDRLLRLTLGTRSTAMAITPNLRVSELKVGVGALRLWASGLKLRVRYVQHMVGKTVCFLFIIVSWATYREAWSSLC